MSPQATHLGTIPVTITVDPTQEMRVIQIGRDQEVYSLAETADWGGCSRRLEDTNRDGRADFAMCDSSFLFLHTAQQLYAAANDDAYFFTSTLPSFPDRATTLRWLPRFDAALRRARGDLSMRQVARLLQLHPHPVTSLFLLHAASLALIMTKEISSDDQRRFESAQGVWTQVQSALTPKQMPYRFWNDDLPDAVGFNLYADDPPQTVLGGLIVHTSGCKAQQVVIHYGLISLATTNNVRTYIVLEARHFPLPVLELVYGALACGNVPAP